MINMKIILILISLFLSVACQQNAPTTSNQIVKPIATVSTIVASGNTISANAAPSISPTNTPDKTKIKTFDGKGVVTKINLELISVELDHEEIKGLMPKMKMEFYVKEKGELERLKVGDTVDFVLEDNAGAEQIISIIKAK